MTRLKHTTPAPARTLAPMEQVVLLTLKLAAFPMSAAAIIAEVQVPENSAKRNAQASAKLGLAAPARITAVTHYVAMPPAAAPKGGR